MGQFLKCMSSPSRAYQPCLSQCCLMCCSSLTSLLTFLCAQQTTFQSLICVLLSFSLSGEVLQNYLVLKILGVIQAQMMASLSSAFLLLTFLTRIFFCQLPFLTPLAEIFFSLCLGCPNIFSYNFCPFALNLESRGRIISFVISNSKSCCLIHTPHPLCCLHSELYLSVQLNILLKCFHCAQCLFLESFSLSFQ